MLCRTSVSFFKECFSRRQFTAAPLVKHSLKEEKKFCVAKVLFFLKRMSTSRPLEGFEGDSCKFGSCLRASYDLLHIHNVQTRLYIELCESYGIFGKTRFLGEMGGQSGEGPPKWPFCDLYTQLRHERSHLRENYAFLL